MIQQDNCIVPIPFLSPFFLLESFTGREVKMLSVTLTSGENIYENLTFSENGMIQYITVFKEKNGGNL